MPDHCKNFRIFISTWNVGEADPLESAGFEKLLKSDVEVDFYAIGFQEIKTGAKETAKSFINHDNWAKALMEFLSKKNFYLIESVRVQGISISVFASMKHLPFVRFVKTEIERTGVAGAWGNKGGVAVSANIYGQKVCFLNVHLSAHLNNDDARIDDINEIMREMEFGGDATVQSHDLILMFGDMNFRIDDFSREEIIKHVANKNYAVLWEKDQLKKHKKVHDLLAEFEEGTLDFDPTYKYDPGTDTYDTSEKQRKPAWTDRILCRVHPEIIKSTAPPFTIKLIDETFTNHKSFQESDHKPVTGQFDLKIIDDSFKHPLLRIEQQGDWFKDSTGEYIVELYEGMEWNSKDYVGLYKHPLQDFRSYHTYMYLPDLRDRRGSSSSSSSDDEQQVQRSTQGVNNGPNDRIKHLTCKKSQITERGLFVLGYYSHNMQGLVAVSRPFEVK